MSCFVLINRSCYFFLCFAEFVQQGDSIGEMVEGQFVPRTNFSFSFLWKVVMPANVNVDKQKKRPGFIVEVSMTVGGVQKKG